MSARTYTYDVFLGHTTRDREKVRPLAESLTRAGLQVWFEEWQVTADSQISWQIEHGLDASRTFVLCVTEQTFQAEWPRLEDATLRFRDPATTDRSFIAVRIEPAAMSGSLGHAVYLNLYGPERDASLAKLVHACRPPATARISTARLAPRVTADRTHSLRDKAGIRTSSFALKGKYLLYALNYGLMRLWDLEVNDNKVGEFFGHHGVVSAVAWDPAGVKFLSCGYDKTVRLWSAEERHHLSIFKEHVHRVRCVAWVGEDQAASGGDDETIRLWNVASGNGLRTLSGHKGSVFAVTYVPEKHLLLSGGQDQTIRIWDLRTGKCLRVIEGHTGPVRRIVCTHDGRSMLSGSDDGTVRVWDLQGGFCTAVLQGHTDGVRELALHPDEALVLSASGDMTLRLWELRSAHCLCVMSGHFGEISSITWTDVQEAASADQTCVKRWNLRPFLAKANYRRYAAAPATAADNLEDHVQYTNAKVLLVGESGAGKTGLSKRLASDRWEVSDSTLGAWATQWKLPVESDGSDEREIWLWDFGGQADQRLIHQLYMDDTALVVLTFDGQKPDLFESLSQWDRDLERAAARMSPTKLLVAARIDAGSVRASKADIDAFVREKHYRRFLETSAKTGQGCNELRKEIVAGIRWTDIPWRSTPLLFRQLKEEIVKLKDEGRVLIRFNELREALKLRLSSSTNSFSDEQLRSVLSLLSGPGVIWELKFGSWVLLQPERVNQYAQAVIQTLREDTTELGSLPEDRVLNGDLIYHDRTRLERDDERFVLLAMQQLLVERGLCLREHTETGTLLVFPSYYKRQRPELVGHPAVLVSYRFQGFVDEIYATLVVRLHHTKPYRQEQLWQYAADFRTGTGKQVGVKVTADVAGGGLLEIYCDPVASLGEKILFTRYVHEHLLQKATDVQRRRHYVCRCGTPVENLEATRRRLAEGKDDIGCAYCDDRIKLWDDLEEMFASDETAEKIRELEEEVAIKLDNESKERALVGEVMSTAALANQICREKTVSDNGIDMEIEFKDDLGRATGALLFLQLKSGDSHLRRRAVDNAEIFTIDNPRHVTYWMDQIAPVMLVIRDSKGETRWMEIREYLIRESRRGTVPVKHIVFAGSKFDVMAVQKMRNSVLSARRAAQGDAVRSGA